MKKIILTSMFFLAFYTSVSQEIINLNVSNIEKNYAPKDIGIKNINDFVSIKKFALNPKIKNNELNIGDKIIFNFDEFENKEAIVTYKRLDVNNVTSYICKFHDYSFSQAFISINSEEYLISIDIPEQNRKFTTHISNDRLSYYIVELDTSNLNHIRCKDQLILESNLDDKPSTLPKHNLEQEDYEMLPNDKINSNSINNLKNTTFNTDCNSLGPEDPAESSILILYTQDALNYVGSVAGMNNVIAQQITKANNASINSNFGMNFILAHSELTTYVESDSGSYTDLSNLRGKTDGNMDNVHDLRNSYSADFVHLFSYIEDVGGLGYLLQNRNGREDSAFALSRVQQLASSETFIHEIGHNMGANHAKGQTTEPGPTSWNNWSENNWSAGWRFQGSNNAYYATIMTYEDSSHWPDGINSIRISYFSTPLQTFMGAPLGDAVDADNLRSIKETKQAVSRYGYDFYCTTSVNATNYYINSVNINTINKNSGWNGYGKFTFERTCLEKGLAYTMNVGVNDSDWGFELRIWVDWNDDLDFEDPGEEVYTSGPGDDLLYTTSITPPPNSILGPVRMRVKYERIFDGTQEPCGESSFGDVEDYTLIIENGNWTCLNASVPTNLNTSSISDNSAEIIWDEQPNVLYDIRYRESFTTAWSEIPNIIESNINLTELTANTEYELQVRSKCPDGTPTSYSSSIFLKTNVLPLDYCESEGLFPFFSYIGQIQFSSIDQLSVYEDVGYSDFTNISTTVFAGQDYSISILPISPTSSSFNAYSVWIDYNQNGNFDDDELVFSQPLTSTAPVSGVISIPASALEGITQMRISMNNDGIPNPCDVFDIGEVEDYTVDISNQTMRVADNHFGSDFSLFPNPVINGQFSIRTPNLKGEVNINIFNLLGQIISEQELAIENHQINVNAGNLSTGVYLIRLSKGNQSFSAKLIVE